MKNISNRLKRVTTLNVASPTESSRYRASWYGLGGWTGAHSDVYGISQGKEVDERFRDMSSSGDYIMSVLIWVNNVKYGGATFFSSPESYDVVTPSRGSAFFWVSTKSSGENDEHQVHGGCPICKGSKFVIGKWIYNFDNWRTIPCGLHQDSDIDLNILPNHN